MTRYNQEIAQSMLFHFSQLNEKDQRHYAATEVLKLSYGGQKYISDLLKISPARIRLGIMEVQNPILLAKIPKGKIRRIGGGRKKKKLATPK